MSANPNLADPSDVQLLIEKLVDGELDHSTRSRWLSSLTDDSHLWREIALAFVEKQVTDEALVSLRDHEKVASGPTERSIVPESSGEVFVARSLKRHHLWQVAWIAGLATCLMVGIFIGLTHSLPDSVTTAETQMDRPPVDIPALEQQRRDSSVELADALSRSVAPVPNEFRRALLKAGYSLQDKQTITSVSLPTGGQINLPIRDVNVTYVGLSSFQ